MTSDEVEEIDDSEEEPPELTSAMFATKDNIILVRREAIIRVPIGGGMRQVEVQVCPFKRPLLIGPDHRPEYSRGNMCVAILFNASFVYLLYTIQCRFGEDDEMDVGGLALRRSEGPLDNCLAQVC